MKTTDFLLITGFIYLSHQASPTFRSIFGSALIILASIIAWSGK